MSTWNLETTYRCSDDCKQSGCPSHKLKLSYNNTSESFSLLADGKYVFGGDINLLESFLELLKHVGACEVKDLIKNLSHD